MKFTSGIFVLYAFFLIGVLSPLGLGGPPEVKAVSETNHLTVDQILEHVENKYTNSKFAADFIQKSTIKAMNIKDMATGKVYIKYPGMMRWEYEKPERQIIITDGDKLWVYRPEDNQVMTVIRQKFDISLEPGQPAESDLFHHLKLIPREKTLDIAEIRLMVSKQTFNVLQVMTLNFYGDETRIDLINFAFGVDMDDSLFSFTIPQGVDVLQIDE
jgi:outer membrane lipoprotein carrier protein